MYQLQVIEQNNPSYPNLLIKRLGKEAPKRLWAIGSLDLLNQSRTAFFCSNQCPGDAILAAMDQARKWRDEGRCIISGFHSPIEKECLNILLRGVQPIIICPARSLERMRIAKEWRQGIEAGRTLLLSPFEPSYRRITTALSEQRNKFIAAMAAEICFAYVKPKGKAAQLATDISGWEIPQVLF